MQSQAPVGLGFVDRDFRLLHINPGLAAISGGTVADQLGRPVGDVVPELWPQLEPLYRQILDDGRSFLDVQIDDSSVGGGGRPHYWQSNLYPVVVDGEIAGIGVVVVDITESKKSEEDARRLAALVEASGDVIYGADNDDLYTSWNGAAERLFGYTAREIIGRSTAILVPHGRSSGRAAMMARLRAGGGVERHISTARRKDGSVVAVVVTAAGVTDLSGRVTGVSVVMQDDTQRSAAQRAVEASESRLAEAQRVAQIGSFEIDAVTGQHVWSAELYRILGVDVRVTPSNNLLGSMVHPEDRWMQLQGWQAALLHGTPFDVRYRMFRVDGSQRWVAVHAIALLADDGSTTKLVGTLMDVTDRVDADHIRRAAETRFEIAFEQGVGAAIVGLDGRPTRVNAAACALLGRSASELVGHGWTDFYPAGEETLLAAMESRVAGGSDVLIGEQMFARPDGSVVYAAFNVTLVRDDAGQPQYYLTQLQDITERKQVEQALAHQTLHDSLTGLPNRALLTDRLIQGLADTRRRGSGLGVVFLNVDQFKEINDSLGHERGDDLLRTLAERIRSVVGPSDTVARFGGDEFVVVCVDASSEQIEHVAESVLDIVSRPYRTADEEKTVTASLGIAVAGPDATPDSLLRDSDNAMHLAKGRGRARVELFDAVLQARTSRRDFIAAALQGALDRREFTVHYQPVVDISSGAMVSAEALLRWEIPGSGSVSPGDFIPVAEETGAIVAIGAWVLEQACRMLVGWQRTDPTLTVAVNLSVRQIVAPDVVNVVADVFRRTEVPAESVWLELTESIFMDDAAFYTKTLDQLKHLGVKLSIDDFGTGFSSLSYLKKLPVDGVKVDKSFVDGLGSDPHDATLVAAILSMADALDLTVTAEGVETQSQLDTLQRLRCRRVQGFFFARPLPGADIDRIVSESHRWRLKSV